MIINAVLQTQFQTNAMYCQNFNLETQTLGRWPLLVTHRFVTVTEFLTF